MRELVLIRYTQLAHLDLTQDVGKQDLVKQTFQKIHQDFPG